MLFLFLRNFKRYMHPFVLCSIVVNIREHPLFVFNIKNNVTLLSNYTEERKSNETKRETG